MLENYFVGVYWGVRKESLEECADRSAILLQCLAECHPSLVNWFLKGNTRQIALEHPLTVERKALQTLLSEGKNLRDSNREAMDDLGYRVSLWNGGQNSDSASLSIKCGSYAPLPGINSCLLNFPHEKMAGDEKLSVDQGALQRVVTDLIECMASAWNPDWGIANSRSYQNQMSASTSDKVRIGWVTYLPLSRGLVPPLPAPARVAHLKQGSIIIATNEPLESLNPAHVAVADEITAILDNAEMLAPIKLSQIGLFL